jgi:hypothetical protein
MTIFADSFGFRASNSVMAQSHSKGKDISSDSRRGYARRLGSLLPPEAKKALRKLGFAEAEIVTKWARIVGRRLGQQTSPIRLTYRQGQRRSGTLHIMVESGFALELQHIEPLLIERVNSYFGYAAVEKLAIQQGALPQSTASRTEQALPLSQQNQEAVESMIGGTRDADLKSALQGLGQRILASKHKKGAGR